MSLFDFSFLTYGILIVVGGLSTGALSMWLYQVLSPQEAINELRNRLRHVQQDLRDYDGDFEGMTGLLQESVWLSFKRLGYTFGPSLIAGLPVLAFVYFLEVSQAAQYQYITLGPEWVGSWLTLCLAMVSLSALTVKLVFRIH